MDLTAMIQAGTVHPVVLVGMAMMLGALHGLEPGHSKTMMAAFIIAVRGTVGQAILLGLSAAFSHTIIVWMLAIIGLKYGNAMIAEELEPWLVTGSGVVVLLIAAVMIWQLRRREAKRRQRHHHHHHHHHDHGHTHHHHHEHGSHEHLADDAHAQAHAQEIETRFASGKASNWQVLGFGLTGGMLPCVAAVTVLLLCLQIQQFWLGVSLVAGFSGGLALMLIAVGVITAWGMGKARSSWPWLEAVFDRAPYISAGMVGVIGLVMLYSGISHFQDHSHGGGHTPQHHYSVPE